MNIPQLDPCRFISLPQIKKRIAEDNFSYKSVRVLGKLKQSQNEKGFSIIEQDDEELIVNTFMVRDRQI
jgi:hypothetical protein